MLHGDDVILSRSSIQIPEKEVFPLGILHDSHCYGVFRRTNNSVESHLIVTPIPPDAWPIAFRLRVRLSHKLGAFAAITAVLKEWDCNILFEESGLAGVTHAVLNLTCEALPLKSWAKAQRQQCVTSPSTANGTDRHAAELQRLAHVTACRLYIYMHRLAWAVRACGIVPLDQVLDNAKRLKNDPSALTDAVSTIQRITHGIEPLRSDMTKGYIDCRFLFGQRLILNYTPDLMTSLQVDTNADLLSDLNLLGTNGRVLLGGRWVGDLASAATNNTITSKDLINVMRREGFVHGSPAVYPTLMPTLLGLWRDAAEDQERLEFVYDATRNRLHVDREGNRIALRQYDNIPKPQRAPALLSTREDFLHIVAQTSDAAPRRHKVTIDYRAKDLRGDSRRPASSIGLCNTLANVLKSHLELDQTTSRMTKRPQQDSIAILREECGVLEFSGRSTSRDEIDKQMLSNLLVSALEDAHDVQANAKVDDLSACRIFVSAVFDTPIWKRCKVQIVRVFEEHGVDPIILDEKTAHTTNLTATILDKVREADGFIQILGVESIQKPKIPTAKLGWVTAEYAMALALNKPVCRLVESVEGELPSNTWATALKVASGSLLPAYDNADDLLENVLPRELQKMIQHLAGPAHGTTT